MKTYDINVASRWTTLTFTLCDKHVQRWRDMGAFVKLSTKQKENEPCHDCEKVKKSGTV